MTAVAATRRPVASPVVVHADADARRWDAYVMAHPQASGYHRYGWRHVIARAFGHETQYLTAESAAGIVGVLPLVVFRSLAFGRFAVSLPFVNYGGVVADSPDAASALLEAAVGVTRAARGRHLELRHTAQAFPQLPAKRHKVAMVVDLQESAEAQWGAIDRKVRNQVRKAEKSGFRVVQGGPELLSAFYDVFARNMRDLGTPVYSARLFQAVLEEFPAASRLFAVFAGEKPVAASLVYWHGTTIEVPWASSLREFNAQCPNLLLYWEMFRFAAEKGFRRFDLGRSTPGEGTFLFKRQWGAAPQELVWEYWAADGAVPDLSPKNPRYERAIAWWRRLPVGFTRVVGPQLVRNIP
jgi:serine/alanine adding enzyme